MTPATVAALVLAALWCGFALIAFWATRRLPLLPERPSIANEDRDPARVSVIVAARDEEPRIRDTVGRLLTQRGVELELIVVDDRSDDGTAAILDELAEGDPRLQVVRIDTLPQGWLGKPHACHVGASHASGDWMLFTDADTWMDPDLVFRALAAARRDGADHVAVFPGEEGMTLAARAAVTLIYLATSFAPALVNRDQRHAAVGIGAFNLVRADLYRASGGYERLRMEVLDDLKLGVLLRRAGGRARVYDGRCDMHVHWARDIPGLIRAVDKNMFALFAFNPWLALAGAATPMLVWAGTLLAPLVLGSVGWVSLAAMATTWIPGLHTARRGNLGLAAVLLSPLTVPVPVAMIVNSTLRTLRQGGIRWRRTFYPLADLRRGRVPSTGGGA